MVGLACGGLVPAGSGHRSFVSLRMTARTRMTAVFNDDRRGSALEQMVSCERGGMERNEGRNERSGVQDKRAARTQKGGGKSVTNCEAKRST